MERGSRRGHGGANQLVAAPVKPRKRMALNLAPVRAMRSPRNVERAGHDLHGALQRRCQRTIGRRKPHQNEWFVGVVRGQQMQQRAEDVHLPYSA